MRLSERASMIATNVGAGVSVVIMHDVTVAAYAGVFALCR